MEAPKAIALNINIHPLVVLSIADHMTRDTWQTRKGRIIGVLFGKQSGRDVDILETCELSFKTNGETVQLGLEEFGIDHKLFIEAYPNYELLGWYSNGKEPWKGDKLIHDAIKEYNDRPLYMLMDDKAPEETRELPIYLYEEQVQVASTGEVSFNFGLTPYAIGADEAERITVVHCARAGGADEGSSVRSHYSTLVKAVRMLHERISVIHQYLLDVQQSSEKTPIDHGILRSIKGLTGLLPTMDSQEFSEDFLNEYNDALLLTYLSSVTKGCNVVNDIVDKFNLTYSSSRMAHAGRGGMHGSGMHGGGMSGSMQGMMSTIMSGGM